jgi:hypothetical protein
LIGPIAAPGKAGAMGRMGAFGAGIGGGFGFPRVVAALKAVAAIPKPRATAIPAEGAGKLAPVAGAGLVGAGHATVQVASPD